MLLPCPTSHGTGAPGQANLPTEPCSRLCPQATLVSYEGSKAPSGLLHGCGRAVFASGVAYDGTWANGRMEGDAAALVFPDGVEYSGGMVADAMSGTGVRASANGSRSAETSAVCVLRGARVRMQL
jgi:hypothetical protein